jgi:FAD dependent oxidoreductase TIGR03364
LLFTGGGAGHQSLKVLALLLFGTSSADGAEIGENAVDIEDLEAGRWGRLSQGVADGSIADAGSALTGFAGKKSNDGFDFTGIKLTQESGKQGDFGQALRGCRDLAGRFDNLCKQHDRDASIPWEGALSLRCSGSSSIMTFRCTNDRQADSGGGKRIAYTGGHQVNRAEIAVVGGGILGLAHAYVLARRGRKVVVFERAPEARGASVRNFGMIWPIGQPAGEMHALALRSREIWMEMLDAARLPSLRTGSLHVAHRDDEAAVLREFAEIGPRAGYKCEWLDSDEVLRRSAAIQPKGLLGGLVSPLEITVDPRRILAELPQYLRSLGVELRFGAAVRSVALPYVETAHERWQVDAAIVCSGDDFETLYPEVLAASGLTRCKLQMMRTVPQPQGWRLGPALAAGLTLRFYKSFRICSTLAALQDRVAREMPEYDRWAIHVLVSQTADGAITLGDSHEYGDSPDIFDRAEIDELILREAANFLQLPDMRIAQRWNGTYALHPEKPFLEAEPAPGVRIMTAPGGSGMTLSFGLAERTANWL